MSYVVGNDGVIKDPYVVEEFQKIQAFLKGLEGRLTLPPEQPDKPVPTKPDNPDTPGNAVVGQKWITGPWTIGMDGAGAPKNIPSYAVCQPPEIGTSQNDFAPEGINSAIVLELSQSATPLNITGIRIGGREVSTGFAGAGTFYIYPRRVLAIYNRGGGDLKLVNESSSSAAQNRFSWGGSGDVGEAVTVGPGQAVWLVYDPRSERWRLFGLPAVGSDSLPPSLTSSTQFPPDYTWSASRTPDGAVVVGIGEQTPVQTFDTAAAVNAVYGFGRRLNTSNISGNGAGIQANHSVTMAQCDPTWTYILQTGASVANVRIWVILMNGATSNVDEFAAARNYMGFRFSTVVPDTGWVGVTKDGTTQAVTAEVAAIAADTLYKLKIRKSGSSVFFSVNGGAEIEQTNNLPSATSQLTWYAFVYTQAAASKSLVLFQEHLKHSTEA